MLSILASGSLVKDPVQRRGKTDKPFATGLLRVPTEGPEAMLCSLIAFRGPAVEALMNLSAGDSVAVSGHARLSEWQAPGGETRRGLDVVVELVLTAYQLEKRRSKAQADDGSASAAEPASEPAQAPAERAARPGNGGGKHFEDMADDIPF